MILKIHFLNPLEDPHLVGNFPLLACIFFNKNTSKIKIEYYPENGLNRFRK